MKYTKEENKDFALKLTLLDSHLLIQRALDIRADRFTNKELLEIIEKSPSRVK